MKKRKFKYFVAYGYVDENGNSRLGNCEVTAEHDITTMEDVKVLSSLIQQKDSSIKSPVIINWKYLQSKVS